MKITALAPWYGSNRILAKYAGRLLQCCKWVGLPFAGGMCELAHMNARTMLVSDLHRHVINLAMVVADQKKKAELIDHLNNRLFHSDVLDRAQKRCLARERMPDVGLQIESTQWAVDYFVCCWMARNGTAGTTDEFKAGLSVRWDAGGGDSVVRFRNAAASLEAWHKIAQRCTFVCIDVFDFLDKVKDKPEHGLYLDAPWPTDGDHYKHTFTEAQQRRLADRLDQFQHCRLVIRYGDHPLILELYHEDKWKWNRLTGRTVLNKPKQEVLITRRC